MKTPTPPQSAHKTWAAAAGALMANVISFGLAYLTGTELSADTYALLVTVLTPVGAAAGAYLKRNYLR